MKNLFTFLIFCFVTSINAQVTSVNYLMEYNCETNLYEIKIRILEGTASNVTQRVQFNSQISMVIPTGLDFEIIEFNNPLQNNQNYNGTTPCNWNVFTPVISPPEQPESDFYAITPQLSPASFYNNLNVDDEILLFQCKIGTDTEYNPLIRFFNNEEDPLITSAGSNFSNGFSLGSPSQIYQGNEYKSCISNVEDISMKLNTYPNPFNHVLTIDMERVPKSLSITNMVGKIFFEDNDPITNRYEISTSNYPIGVYVIRYKDHTGEKSVRVVKH